MCIGGIDDPSNFRPISVVLAKILEKLAASQLSEEFQLLSQYHGAYRAGRSTE